MPPTLDPIPDITRYAEVLAHIRHFPSDKHAEVIARLGIRRADWKAAAEKWQRARDSERVSGKLDFTIRFGKVLAAVRADLEARRPSIESLGPLPGPDDRDAARAAAVATESLGPGAPPSAPAQAGSPVLEMPTYLVVEEHDRSRAPMPAEMASTMPLGAVLPLPATPFRAATAPDEALGRAVAHARVTPRESSAPNTGQSALSLEQYASLRVEMQRQPELRAETLSRYGLPTDALESLDAHWNARFAAEPQTRAAFARAFTEYQSWLDGHGAPAVRPDARPADLAETAGMDLSAIVSAVQRVVLPFAPSTGRAPSADRDERREEARPTMELPTNLPEGPGGTMNADFSAIVAAVSQGGLPWKRPADEVDLSPMPLATFAEISGALARGEPREEALAKHGLSAETFSKLAQGWAQRFLQDPALAATFKELARASASTTKKG